MYLVEEFYYASLDLKQLDWSRVFLGLINKNYPQSVKANRMLAMLHEASQDYGKAKEIYNELLATNPGDMQTLKRLVALERD